MARDASETGRDAPFFHAIDQARTAAEDFTRFFADLKLPAMPDMEVLLNAHRRNMEALAAANRVALEGAQAVARRQAEITQQTLAEFTDALRSLASPESPQMRAARQADLLKRAYSQAVTNLRELGDMIQRSNAEAIGLINGRFAEAMDEVKALAQKGSRSG
jgi:phasin family protein